MSRDSKTFIAALLATVYFFLIMTGYYVIKPLRDSSFLSSFHPNWKPVFNVFSMILLIFLASGYNYLLTKKKGIKFLRLFFGGIILSLITFRLLFPLTPALAGALFYFWLACINVICVTLFWTQINTSFTKNRDRFYYIIIALGGTIGGAMGGKFTSFIVPSIGTDNLLLVACFIFSLSYLMAYLINHLSQGSYFQIEQKKNHQISFKNIISENYAFYILLIVIIGTFVQSIYDYQLAVYVKNTLENSRNIFSIFYGNLYFKMNIFSIFAELILAPLILITIGAGKGMYLFILLIFGTNTLFRIDPSLFVIEWMFIFFAGSGYSIIQIFREQLYIPAPQSIKISYKSFIDTVGFKSGDALAAVVILGNLYFFQEKLSNLSTMIFIAGIIATFSLWKINKIYTKLLRGKGSEG